MRRALRGLLLIVSVWVGVGVVAAMWGASNYRAVVPEPDVQVHVIVVRDHGGVVQGAGRLARWVGWSVGCISEAWEMVGVE